MTRHVYPEIKSCTRLKRRCECGRVFQKTITECQTVNPYNRGKDGQPKTADQIKFEIDSAVDIKSKAWLSGEGYCIHCRL